MGGIPSKPDPAKFDSVQVIGAGFSRTGTNSLQLALEKLLDGPVQHGGTQFHAEEDSFGRTWCEALEAKQEGEKQLTLKLVRKVTRGFVGITDVPGILVLEEMLELYPEAKVILVLRDPRRWAKSFDGILVAGTAWYIPIITAIRPGTRWLPRLTRLFEHFTGGIVRDSNIEPGNYGPEFLEEYNRRVIQTVPKERLLVMRLGEGWEPMCKFLGKPVPNEPFPRANDSKAVDRFISNLLAGIACRWIGLFAGVGLTFYYSVKLCT